MRNTALEDADIQAIVRGPSRQWQCVRYVFLRFDGPELARKTMQTLGAPASIARLRAKPPILKSIAFTYRGLARMGVHPEILSTFPDDFRQGMRLRAGDLGDTGKSAPEHWDPTFRRVDAVIAIYARDPAELEDHYLSHVAGTAHARYSAVTIIDTQDAHRLVATSAVPVYLGDKSHQPPDGTLLEHFGFNDGVTSPAVQGLDERDVAGNGKFQDGRWEPLAAGEFLLGHLDEVGEMPRAPKPDALAHNGTFMVYRKLEQNVVLFRQYVLRIAQRDNVDPDYVAAKMVGRRRDGSNFVDKWRINGFLYDMDRKGHHCPLGAHVRRSNPRDTLGYETRLIDRHRILRRSFAYGPLLGANEDDGKNPESRGLIFIALNADISRQFEFIQQQWINFGNDLEQGDDRDPIAGSHDRTGAMIIPSDPDAGKPTIICGELPRFVETRGGDYFFVPGLRAFYGIVEGDFCGKPT